MFIDLWKPFNTIDDDLLFGKLGAYGFQEDALVFMKNYFTTIIRQKFVRVKIMWKDIISGVLQSSILGPLPFNIFLNDLFLFVENSDLINYAGGNTLHSSENDMEQVKRLWNSNKMVLRKLYDFELGQMSFWMKFLSTANNIEMKNSKEDKILEVTNDNKLPFKNHKKAHVKKFLKRSELCHV